MLKVFRRKKLQAASSTSASSKSSSSSDSSREPVSPDSTLPTTSSSSSSAFIRAETTIARKFSQNLSILSRFANKSNLKTKKGKEPVIQQIRSLRHEKNEEAELAKAFAIFDVNNDGRISASELGFVLCSLGDNPTEQELQAIIQHADADGDGFIDLQEFIDVNTSACQSSVASVGGVEPSDEDSVHVAFHMFDKDGNGYISAEELHAVLVSLGERGHTLEDCRGMISCFDKDGDGFVDYEEFQSMLGVFS